jgi:hypothetical protein
MHTDSNTQLINVMAMDAGRSSIEPESGQYKEMAMTFTVMETIKNWGGVRKFLMGRKDILEAFALYEPSEDEKKWTTSTKDANWFYLEGLVQKETKTPIHLSCNSVGGDWKTFHVTEYANNLHVGSFEIVVRGDDDSFIEPVESDFRCIRSTTILTDGACSNMKISGKELKRIEKIRQEGGKISSPKGDMNHLIYAISQCQVTWAPSK